METKKLLVSVALSLSFASSALVAEESGVFVGVGVGHGALEAKAMGITDKLTAAGESYEIIAGYKQFFTPSFGLRYYGNLTYANFKANFEGESGTERIMNYGVNVDALFNFIASESADFGAFVGIGVGGNTIRDGVLDDADQINQKKTHPDVALNIGLRSVIDSKHSLEAIVRVPFMTMTLVDETGDAGNRLKATYSRNYNIGARYIYSF